MVFRVEHVAEYAFGRIEMVADPDIFSPKPFIILMVNGSVTRTEDGVLYERSLRVKLNPANTVVLVVKGRVNLLVVVL